MNIVKRKNWFFALSILVIIPGVVALSLWGLRLGIDFAGGTLWEIKFTQNQKVSPQKIQEIFTQEQAEVSQITPTSENSYLIRMKSAEEGKINSIKEKLNGTFGEIEDTRLETVGPVISKELVRKALIALALAIVGIVLYVTWSFREVPRPTSSISFGICTIIALFHDVLIVVGIFAALGHFFKIEVDSLFITAILTVIGFSVHDTIVVFDRVRENLKKYREYSFEEVINHSILQTI